MLEIDGSLGEGGGQVLRTCLSLSALTKRPFRLFNIRNGRAVPGLRPQHLTAVRAVAALCGADLRGAFLHSRSLEFTPSALPRGDQYRFDVAEAAEAGSAGAVSLIFHTLLWPLLFADTPSQLTLLGGTHVPFSPSYHHLARAAQPLFAKLGDGMRISLEGWGWYPRGGGTITATIEPVPTLIGTDLVHEPSRTVQGLAAVTNLPAHIPQRMARRAHNLLLSAKLHPDVQPLRARGRAPGAGIVLWRPGAGFTALGKKGVPAEQVAENAVSQMLSFLEAPAAVDKYLADQLLLPLALAQGQSSYDTNVLTQHTLTNAALLRLWLDVDIDIRGGLGEPCSLSIHGIGYTRP